jgi:hypothetical protein
MSAAKQDAYLRAFVVHGDREQVLEEVLNQVMRKTAGMNGIQVCYVIYTFG